MHGGIWGLDRQAKTLGVRLCQPLQGSEVRVHTGRGSSDTERALLRGRTQTAVIAAPRSALIQMGQGWGFRVWAPAEQGGRLCAGLRLNTQACLLPPSRVGLESGGQLRPGPEARWQGG